MTPRIETWLVFLVAAALGACDPEPVVQLSFPQAVRDAGAPAQPAPGGSPFSEWEKFECGETDLVCGSDNQTYLNYCAATRAGVAVVKHGPC